MHNGSHRFHTIKYSKEPIICASKKKKKKQLFLNGIKQRKMNQQNSVLALRESSFLPIISVSSRSHDILLFFFGIVKSIQCKRIEGSNMHVLYATSF